MSTSEAKPKSCKRDEELLNALNCSIEVLLEETAAAHVECLMNGLCANCTAELLAEVYSRLIRALTMDISQRTMKPHDVVAAAFVKRVTELVRHELVNVNQQNAPTSKAVH